MHGGQQKDEPADRYFILSIDSAAYAARLLLILLRGSASADTIGRLGFCKMLSNYQNKNAAAQVGSGTTGYRLPFGFAQGRLGWNHINPKIEILCLKTGYGE